MSLSIRANVGLSSSQIFGGLRSGLKSEFSNSLRTSALIGVFSLALNAGIRPIQAATFQVTTLADSGTGSLRAAISQSNTTPEADQITFVPGLKGNIILSSGSLTLSSDLQIVGPGASVLALDGNQGSRIFDITAGKITISGLTLQNGAAKGQKGANGYNASAQSAGTAGGNGADASGGAVSIANQAALTLTQDVLTNNFAEGGRGGTGGNGYVSLDTGRRAAGPGGSGGTARGGAIYNEGTLTVVQSSFSGNIARGGNGGDCGQSIWTSTPGSTGGDAWGGALFNAKQGTFSLATTTFAANAVTAGQGGLGVMWTGTPAGNLTVVGQSGRAMGPNFFDAKTYTVPTATATTILGALTQPVSAPLKASGSGPLTYILAQGTLPTGLTLNKSNGLITGTPSQAGLGQQVTFVVTDGLVQSLPATATFNIYEVPVALDTTIVGVPNQPLSAQLQTSKMPHPHPLTYSLVQGTLPLGLTLNADTGRITGTPTQSAVGQRVKFQVSDGLNKSEPATVTFNIQAPPDTTAPGVQVNTPTSKQQIALSAFGAGTVTGSARDKVGVTQVQARFSRVRGGVVQYWNGKAFTSTLAFVPATLATPSAKSSNWAWDKKVPPISALDAGTYTVSAYAVDAAGNTSGLGSRTFALTASAKTASANSS